MRNIVKNILLSSFFLIIVSCGVTNKKLANPNTPLFNNTVGEITIDSAGIIPIIGVNRATTTAIYIRNHSNKPVYDIRFNSYQVNQNIFQKTLDYITGKNNSKFTIDEISASSCNTIEAQGVCALKIVTPSYSTQGNQEGSINITAKFMVNGEVKTFEKILNYQQVEDIKDRAYVTSGLNLNSYGYDVSYGTIYVYSGNQSNKIKSLTFNKPAIKISNNNITGSILPPFEVQAVEITAPADIISSVVSMLTVITESTGLTSVSTVTALPKDRGAILEQATLPYYDLVGQSSISGSYQVTNVGDESAILGDINVDNSIISIESNVKKCEKGMVIGIGKSCILYFRAAPQSESEKLSGSGLITINYSSSVLPLASITNVVNWTNSQRLGVLTMLFDTPNTFIRNDGIVGANESFNIVLKNIKGVSLSNIALNIRSLTGGMVEKPPYPCTKGFKY
jgi:hypothetical protein